MARLYADENFPRPVVESLRTLGHDVLTAQEAGQDGRGVPDPEVLASASLGARAVLTLNRKHFFALHNTTPGHAGIIACTYDPAWDDQAARIDNAIRLTASLAGQLIRVNRPPR